MDKNQLIVIALQQQISELASNYEIKIASLRADITLLTNKLEEYEAKTAETKE